MAPSPDSVEILHQGTAPKERYEYCPQRTGDVDIVDGDKVAIVVTFYKSHPNPHEAALAEYQRLNAGCDIISHG